MPTVCGRRPQRLCPLLVLGFPVLGLAQVEIEPNDTKAQANLVTLPLVSTAGVIQGNSTSASGVGLDYFQVTVPPRDGLFFRHRLIATSAIVGHTLTLRGLNQAGGIPGTVDTELQQSSAATTPPRFVQWYTSMAGGEIFVRVSGTGLTTADYLLNYEVLPVDVIEGPIATPGPVTITTVDQSSPQTDTDLWIYDSNGRAIPDFGNDDAFASPTLGSTLTRTYGSGTYFLALSNFNLANEQASPEDDDFTNGPITDFPGPILNSSTTQSLDLDSLIDGVPVSATKVGPYDVVFVRFGDVLFADGFESGDTAAWRSTTP